MEKNLMPWAKELITRISEYKKNALYNYPHSYIEGLNKAADIIKFYGREEHKRVAERLAEAATPEAIRQRLKEEAGLCEE